MNKFRTCFRRIVPAMLFSAAVTFGTVDFPATATAENGFWDIEKFDDCLATYGGHAYQYCCLDSGGEIGQGGKCVAPAPQTQGSTGNPAPKPPKLGVPLVPVQPPLVG
jgi:hypothetical protein